MSNILIPGAAPSQAAEPEPKAGGAPAILLEYHPDTQSVSVRINPEKIKTWDFARAVLTMGVQAADRMADAQMAKAAQAAMQEAALAQAVMRDVVPGRRARA